MVNIASINLFCLPVNVKAKNPCQRERKQSPLFSQYFYLKMSVTVQTVFWTLSGKSVICMYMIKKQTLIEKSREIFQTLDIGGLQGGGIVKENIKTSSHSHIIVTYPPLSVLPEINPNAVYSNNFQSPREMAIYLHLPFCTGKCSYCAYVSLANQPASFIEKYLNALEKEINLLAAYFKNTKINSVYIGGGTPTYLSAQQIEKVFYLLKEKFNIRQGAEITVEASPETIVGQDGNKKLKTLRINGANRLSIGFQTFDNNILKLVRRRHNAEQAIKAYKLAKKVGFENINIDLMAGLPGQTLEIWQNDLNQAAKLKPASITCYPFYLKKESGLWPMYQKEKKIFPTQENIILMRIMADKFLSEQGYAQRPVYWFTKDSNYVYKQQIHKWGELGNQLALGVSGYSFISGFQYFHFRNVSQYLQALENNQLPIWKGAKLSQEDLARRLIIFGLKTGLSKKLFKAKFNKNPKEVFKEIWKKLDKLGLIKEDAEMIKLSLKGELFVDEVCQEFYSDKVRNKLKF